MSVVYFIGSDDRLEIQRRCKVCRVTQEDVERFQIVVSPRGVAHRANEYGDTDCGKDATRNGWWWKS